MMSLEYNGRDAVANFEVGNIITYSGNLSACIFLCFSKKTCKSHGNYTPETGTIPSGIGCGAGYWLVAICKSRAFKDNALIFIRIFYPSEI